MRCLPALGLIWVLLIPRAGVALSLPGAIAAAQRSNPTLAQAQDEAQAADARLSEARAGRLPSLVLTGEAGVGRSDLGGFFGFHGNDITPRGAALELRQPVFSGGSISAGIARAREGREAALAEVAGARALLSARVADAYVAVLTTRDLVALRQAQVGRLEEVARQADLRFKDGEIARTGVAQSQARLAESQAGLVKARGDMARARAHFVAVVGSEPDALEPPGGPPATPARIEDALAMADQSSPMLLAAQARERAARQAVRASEAERLPSVALAATASTTRDNFFPGYRADGVTVGVEGRWTLFSGGLVTARIEEARANARAAQSALDAARAEVREAVVGGWQDLETARALLKAAVDEAASTGSALDSVRQEVRVGQKPTLDLLDAEREDLAARSALIAAHGDQIVEAYRLDALLHGG